MKLAVGVIGLLLVQVVSVYSQKEYSLIEFEKIRDAATAILDSIAYRETTITENYPAKNEPLRSKFQSTNTVVPPNSRHWFSRTFSDDKVVYEQEAIFVGEATYLRDGIVGWRKVPQNSNKYTAIDKNQYERAVIFKGEKEISGKKIRHFLLTIKWSSNGVNRQRDEEFWFDEKGRLQESALEGDFGFENVYRKERKKYEYDMPQPKIEAPIK